MYFSYWFVALNDVLQNVKKYVFSQRESFSTNTSPKLDISSLHNWNKARFCQYSDTLVLQKKLIRIWYSFQICLKKKNKTGLIPFL